MSKNGEELLKSCAQHGILISEYAIRLEEKESGFSRKEINRRMKQNLDVMIESAEYGLKNKTKSVSGLLGGEAYLLQKYIDKGNTLTGEFMVKAMARALSCSEVNASMGRIVAAPTAGSCGILPAVIITAAEKLGKDEEAMIRALFTASAIGMLIAQSATLAGAEGGCQAECGSAAAMGAAAVVEMMGGTPAMSLDAGAIVIQNILGLVCDPIAGLVEVPCAKRNSSGAVSALTTADMVMSGIGSIIPFDEMVEAMYKVGKSMPCQLRETAQGGTATTPTALRLKRQIFGD
jgi:L-serine dehydratase